MAIIPENLLHSTLHEIDKSVQSKYQEDPRPHLGASQIGKECDRYLWYSFRWAHKVTFPPRMLRLFQRGHREEMVLIDLLRSAGVQVWDVDPRTGKQFSVQYLGGHLSGSTDGVGKGIIEAPKTPHLLEFKTFNDKTYSKLIKEKVQKAKPEHYVQTQIYMKGLNLTRAFYMAVNKNDDSIYTERIKINNSVVGKYINRAKMIITASRPLSKLSERPDWYQCKFCDSRDICHGDTVAEVNCRTCLHSTPVLDGYQKWRCEHHNLDIPEKAQRMGCRQHRFIPDLVGFAKQVDASAPDNSVKYEYQGIAFDNAEKGSRSYLSSEIKAMGPALITDKKFQSLRDQFDGQAVEATA